MAKVDGARENGLKAFKNIKHVLTVVGWEPEATESEDVLRVDFSSDGIPIADALADVRTDYERFLFYLNFRDHAAAEYRDETMEFITRANSDLVIGNFELSFEDGSVRFKSAIDFTNTELSKTLIHNAIRSAMDAVEQYADALVEVMRGEKAAEKAIQQAERGAIVRSEFSAEVARWARPSEHPETKKKK